MKPPISSLAARLSDFDPYDVSRGLADRSLVRLLTLRGTIHLLTADDAVTLQPWTQPVHDKEGAHSVNVRPAAHLDRTEVRAAVAEVLAEGERNEVIGKMRVSDLLQSMPGLGKVRAKAVMERLNISENRRVRGLGAKQAAALVAEFPEDA